MSVGIILDINNLSLSIGVSPNEAAVLHDISFQMSQGEILGLVGESGSGKTMTLRCIMRLLEQYPRHKLSGKIIYESQNETNNETQIDIVSASDNDIIDLRKNDIGIIFQQSAQVLNPSIALGDQIMERMLLRDIATIKADAKSKVIKLLDEVLLSPSDEYYDRYPHELSGGQLQRGLIALALANDPRLLLADEPTFSLDSKTEREIIGLLLEIKKNRNLSILIVSHDMDLISGICDRYITLSDGKVVENLPQDIKPKISVPKNFTEDNREPIVQLSHINKSYKKSVGLWTREKNNPVLQDFNLTINRGIIHGLVGPSGCGKSTVAKIIAGIDYDYQGDYLLNGQDVKAFHKTDLKRMRKTIQIIFQDSYSAMPPHLPAIALFDDVISAHKMIKSRAQIIDALNRVGLDELLLDRLSHQLSGGQRQRLLIAKSLIVEPDLLICDEIVSSLDDSNKASVIEVLRQVNVNQGLTILFVSHDMKVIQQLCHEGHELKPL